MIRLAPAGSLFLTLISAGCLSAQSWDNSGNNLLKGTYFFRDVSYLIADGVGHISRALALYGNISFDGNGGYTITTATTVDSNSTSTGTITNIAGTYSISASGYGFLSNPISDGASIYGLVTNGVFVGSSTENGAFNDLFIAVASTPTASNTTFQGNYSMSYMAVAGNPANNYDAIGQFTADGRGNIGTINFTAYVGGGGATPINVPETGVRYNFSAGVGRLSFPTSGTTAVAGTQIIYISPDGNFIFGGASDFWDFFVGVKKGSAASLGGLYYTAGLSEDASQLSTAGYAIIGSSYGSLIATGGNIIGHQRFEDVFGKGVEDDTFSDVYPASAAGEYTSGSTQYDFSQDGGVMVGFGIGPFLGINVALRAPTFSGSGVWLDPTGVRNAASFAPFTAQVADGELMVLFGSGLSGTTLVDSTAPFGTNLGGVQVLVNDVLAPIYYVTPGALAVIVPYGTAAAAGTSQVAQFQVLNNGVPSNVVSAFIGNTAPGMLTQGSNGISDAIVQHLDFTLVTPANPAKPGETLLGYVTGLGDVSPAISDGAPGPSDTLSKATNSIAVYIGGLPATVTFAGLAPTLSGLYSIVFTVPTGVASGDQAFTLGGPDAFSTESILPIAAAGASVAARAVPPSPPAAVRRHAFRRGIEPTQK